MKTALGLLVLGVLWLVVTGLALVPPYVLPTPMSVVDAFRISMVEGVAATVARALTGFAVGVAGAYAAILAAHCAGAMRGADAQFSAARSVPMLAAMPLFLLWFGLGEAARVLVVILAVVAYVAGPLAEAARNLPREWRIQRERLSRSRNWEYWNVIAPGTLGSMIGALRVGLAIAYTTAVATDFMGSSVGLGRSIDAARVTFNVPGIFLLLLLAAVTGLLLDRLLFTTLRSAAHWVGSTAKG